MKKNSSIIIVICFLVLGSVTSVMAQTVFSENFNNRSTGQYDRAAVEDMFGVSFCKGADEGRVHVKSVSGRGNVLEVRYPQGKVKTGESGMHTKIPLGGSYEELYMSYWVYFPSDFEFRAGAKLPGLAHQSSDKNMSLRLMWRYDGLIEYYVHYNTEPTSPDYRASINWSLTDVVNEPQADQVKFKKGEWNHIELYNKLNTPGQANGIMRGWLNGVMAINVTNNRDYRTSSEGDIKLNTIYWSTFFGGSDESYQPTKDVKAYFDDIKVSTSRIGYPGTTGGGGNLPPTVSLTSPNTGTSVNVGNTVNIQANASDDGGIQKIVFKINGATIKEDTSAPYSVSWTAGTAGNYTITAVAFEQGQDNLTAQTQRSITVVSGNSGGGSSGCSFGTPQSNALPGYDGITFNNVYVLGSGGPNQSNIKRFKIKWVPSANGLYAFSINTNNGQPSSYIDLRGLSNASFNTNQPDVTITGSGLPGLDGDYWVADDSGNFVMVAKSGLYTIYCSNSTTAPSCSSAKFMASEIKSPIEVPNENRTIAVFPNPVSSNSLQVKGLSEKENTLEIYDISGKYIYTRSIQGFSEFNLDVSTLKPGVYLIKISNSEISEIIRFAKM